MWYFTSPDWRRVSVSIGQQIQAAAMGHADNHFLHIKPPGALYEFVHHRDQRLCAL
jgi:hypothetical protein